ncbi:MAG: efflux RND transporter periplasmic adaptor subunit [Rhodobacteraceae bacterium]|nr:efflux RND transporter periplasmic adaptor subunit [Paracoccaceae bacterium]
MTETATIEDKAKPLRFESDRASSRSFWIALALTIAIVAWMGSGFVFPSEGTSEEVAAVEVQPVAVTVRTSFAQPVTQFFQAEGQAQPDRDTVIRAQASGQIAEVFVSKGDDIEANAVVARLETKEREADLTRVLAELDRAEREAENAAALQRRGVATADRVVQADAALASARAQLAVAQENLRNTEITAPFGGRIETLDLDVGEFIQTGSEVGRIVDNAPLTVSIQVPQQALRQLKNLQPAQVLFITGEQRAGTVSFVGTSAATDTRTFLVEVDVPNSDGLIPAGISAEVRIPVGQVEAHFLSPSTVSLNELGALGVKVVDAENVVRFHEIDVVRAQIEGIWVQGLPKEAQIITIGQGFVGEGETVRPQNEEGGQ